MPGKSSLVSMARTPLLPAFIRSFLTPSRRSGLCVEATIDVRRTSRAIGFQFFGRSFHARATCRHLFVARYAVRGADGSRWHVRFAAISLGDEQAGAEGTH